MVELFHGETEPLALDPILRGVDLALGRLVQRDCFTERTLRVLDELRAEVLARSVETCPSCGIDLRYPTARHLIDCPEPGDSRSIPLIGADAAAIPHPDQEVPTVPEHTIEHERFIVAAAAFENAWDAAVADYDPETTSPDTFLRAALRTAFLSAGIAVAEPGDSGSGGSR